MALEKHPDALALDNFFEQNPHIRDTRSIGEVAAVNQYLENRLAIAFMAGCEHVRRMSKGEFPRSGTADAK